MTPPIDMDIDELRREVIRLRKYMMRIAMQRALKLAPKKSKVLLALYNAYPRGVLSKKLALLADTTPAPLKVYITQLRNELPLGSLPYPKGWADGYRLSADGHAFVRHVIEEEFARAA